MSMLSDSEKYILDFAAYNEEPLHIIISAVSSRMNLSPEKIVLIIIELASRDYLECMLDSGLSEESLKRINNNEEMILDYVKRNEKQGFSEYPEEEEFYFKTTSKGWELLTSEENE